MITKIKEIKRVDAFESFDWNGADLKRLNLIYGWNGSGKTTISRIFSFLEHRVIHIPDLVQIEFSVQSDGESTKHQNVASHALNLRVFNEDFIRENVVFEQGRAKKIVIIGKENVELQKEIAALESEQREKQLAYDKAIRLRADAAKTDGALTDAGRDVTKQFGDTPLANDTYYGRNYNKTRVEALLADGTVTATTSPGLILAPGQLDVHRDMVKKKRQKVALAPSVFADHSGLFAIANGLIGLAVSVQEIEDLQNDDGLRTWTETGYHLHKDRGAASCLFCGGSIGPDLLVKLGALFTDELVKAKNQIKETLARIDAIGTGAGIPTVDSGELYPDIAAKYIASKAAIERDALVILSAIEALAESLRRKNDNLHDGSVVVAAVEYPMATVNRLSIELKNVTELLSDHNGRVDRGVEQTTGAARAIELHAIASALTGKDYFTNRQTVARIDEEVKPLRARLEDLGRQISTKRAALYNANIAVDRINDLLKDYFGESQLYLEITGADSADIGYVLKSRGKDAKHLSEGEKSVLALIYFFIKLEEDGCDKRATTIVIDDPVDSQDTVFLFRTFGMLKRQLSDAGQVIILTHSFDFFNLVRDWLVSTDKGTQSGFYLITMDKESTGRAVAITDLPDVLKEHKSEYQYLFARLYQHAHGTKVLDAPLVANVGRKVLEYFAGFKWSCKTTEQFTSIVLNRFVDDPNQRKKGVGDFIVKFLHEYSHGQDFARPVTAASFEQRAITENILEFIRLADSEHFDYLKDLC